MAQNTTSSAYRQLQPNKSNNIGNIVQENIRYWRKYEDEKTAREKIQKLREAEFKFKIDGRANEFLESMRPDDAKTAYGMVVVEAFDKDSERLTELAREASDPFNPNQSVALRKYNLEKSKINSLANASKIIESKILSNQKARKEGGFNPILDEPYILAEEAILNKQYTIDPVSKNVKLTLSDGTDLDLTPKQWESGEFLTHEYSEPPKFKEYGNAISENIYSKNPNISDEDAQLLAQKSVRDFFSTNTTQRDSWYGTILKREGINPRGQDPYDKLPLKRRKEIEDAYIEENVQRPVKSTKEKLEETRLTGARLSNQKSRLDISKKEKELELLENPPPKDDKEQEEPKFRIEAKAGQTGRLARTTNINGDDATVFESFKSFKVKTGVDQGGDDVFLEIDSIVLSDDGDISYRDSEGKEGVNPDIIDEIVRKLKFKDRKDLFDEMKANRDYKLSKLENNTSTETTKDTNVSKTGNASRFNKK